MLAVFSHIQPHCAASGQNQPHRGTVWFGSLAARRSVADRGRIWHVAPQLGTLWLDVARLFTTAVQMVGISVGFASPYAASLSLRAFAGSHDGSLKAVTFQSRWWRFRPCLKNTRNTGFPEGETAEPAYILAARPSFKTNNAKGKKCETTAVCRKLRGHFECGI